MRKLPKGVPHKAYQKQALRDYDDRILAGETPPVSLVVVANDPELGAIRNQLKLWKLAQSYAPRRRGRIMDFQALYDAASILDARKVRLKLGYSSRATQLLTREPRIMSLEGARDLVRRLVEISRRIGSR